MVLKVFYNIDRSNDLLWQSRFSDSPAVTKKAEGALKAAEAANYPKGIASAKLNIAAISFYRSDNKTALKYLAEAFRWFDKNRNENGYVRALLIKGNIHESFGDYENTLKYWLEALKASREINDTSSEGEASNQLGLIYSRLCNFQKSLEYFHEGLKIRKELGDENGAASSLNRIGMVLRQTKRYDDSLEYYFKSLDIRKKNKQTSAIPWTLLVISSTYEEMKKYPESIRYYELGLTGGDKRCTLQCLMGTGRVYTKTGEVQLAENRLLESLKMAKELKSLVLISEACSAIATYYELCDKPEKALKYYKQYIKTKESVQSTEVRSKLSNIEVSNAIEKSENEKEIYRLKHVDLKEAYNKIEEINKDITASISYASRIQRAILPEPREIKGLAENIFILLIPKDIVSGDFYWFSQVNDKLIVAAVDCTGHGVPGALMSMLGNSYLDEIVNNKEIIDPARILDELTGEVRKALRQKGEREEAKDGMDIALCVIDKKQNSLQYSGAYNNRMPIGYYDDHNKRFSKHEISIRTGDLIYMFSDGYADQFGGPNTKKFKYAQFKELILKVHSKPMREQKKLLESRFLEWKGSNEQTDDVLVIGLKI
jgi:serine phosphatase RsbU (regulator of sigma subunit)